MAIEELGRANEEITKDFLDHLLRAFEEFCNTYPKEVGYIDGFMAAHNFHVMIVLDLECRLKATPKQQLFWRKVAINTFIKAMEEKP